MAHRDVTTIAVILIGISLMIGDVNTADNIQPRPEQFFYLEKGQQRMVETLEARHKNESTVTIACNRFGKKEIIEAMLGQVRPERIKEVNETEMIFLLNKCSNLVANRTRGQTKGGTPLSGSSNEYKIIYPGTKWCGTGNVSKYYDDLGREWQTDLCCREHDHCNDTIESKMTEYGLTNSGDYTKSHCDCDEKFRICLKRINTRTSHYVGKLFFNIVMLQCFKMDHPIVGCRDMREEWVFLAKKRRCEEYDFNKNLPPIYQFFDPKRFY